MSLAYKEQRELWFSTPPAGSNGETLVYFDQGEALAAVMSPAVPFGGFGGRA